MTLINLAEKQKLNRNLGFLSMLETDAILQRMEEAEQNIEAKARWSYDHWVAILLRKTEMPSIPTQQTRFGAH